MPDAAPAAAAPGLAASFGTPWDEQLAFFRRKLNLPTQRWGDIMNAAHDRAFVVAGAAKADLLDDLRQAVDSSMAEGASGAVFEKRFRQVVAQNGWTGWTGEGSDAGTAWRARVIYDTNLATSYAAGRWRQLTDPAVARELPFWRYRHADGVLHPRPLHVAWDGLTLPVGHPFWQQHFPPNGWGCHCKVFAQNAPAPGADTEPPAGWDKPDPVTGAQPGIDPGFAYAPGARAAEPLLALVRDKLLALHAPIGAAMWQALKPALALEQRLQWASMVDRVAATQQAQGETLLATTVAPDVVAALQANGVVLDNAAVWLRDQELLHALREAKQQRGSALPAQVWRRLPDLLADAVPYLDTQDTALVYAIDAGAGVGKVVVRVNYNAKGRFDGTRASITSNFIQTGGLVDADNVGADPRYLRMTTT